MVMDPGLHELSGMMNGFKFDGSLSDHQNEVDAFQLADTYPNNSFMDLPLASPDLNPNLPVPVHVPTSGPDSPEDHLIFSDIALKYISRMLMEEDVEENISCVDPALKAAEKPFYDILGEKYPPSPDRPPLYVDHSVDSLDDSTHNSSSSVSCVDNEYPIYRAQNSSVDYSSPSSFGSRGSVGAFEESPVYSAGGVTESQPMWQFQRGVEEASKFLPGRTSLAIDSNWGNLLVHEANQMVEVKEEREYLGNGLSRGKKNRHSEEDVDLKDGRSNKQSAVFFDEENIRTPMFDEVLLCPDNKCSNAVSDLRATLQSEVNKNTQSGSSSKGSNGGKSSRGKKQGKKEVVDLRTLLIHCAQAVAADDRRNANELLKQIRQYSSAVGDGSQRLAHCFADGLEARLAGTGSQIYHSLVAKRTTATDLLKAYHLYLAACPFKKVSHFFSNQTIINAAENSSRLHIVDFGIYFGFQWPCLIQRLSKRDGGPPKLRITGIDVPQPGFRPTERIEETGRRLEDYARSFGVPFEYNSIASKWENIRVEDLRIDRDEVLVVNSLYRFRNLVDETVIVDSPRNTVLSMIRKANPDVFIHGVVNGAYSAPFFITRFREALFHFSSLFDMLETNVPREHPERLLIEKDIFGKEALNVIACEGSERVERPETYKQWQVRVLRAGFTQLPLNASIVKKARDKVKAAYHKDFVIDEDNRWLLQGWKGRIIYALSTWRPEKISY
ncbi:Scarecrow-like protein 9 [Acorus calamus]|uniref:Scarecrow-like protein 9 n=1 Tax=Acorus calamus TaxID=4465 RepID=A0AAV9DDM9_ACOCL|nr:Scarecrow-like protein 9 [Acorus calamus]